MAYGVRSALGVITKALVLAVLLAPATLVAGPASLDTSFGTGGIVTTQINPPGASEAMAVARQANGRLVSGGGAVFTIPVINERFALTRHMPNGDIDTSFGANGIVTTDLAGSYERVHAVGIQSDGKIVAAGASTPGNTWVFALARYTEYGALDASFGTGGLVTSNSGMNSGKALIIQSDGKLVIAGNSRLCCKLALARYLPNGTLDSTFGVAGVAAAAVPGHWYAATNALVQQTDGKFVVGGTASFGGGGSPGREFVAARFNNDGTLDTTFGAGGVTVTNFNGGDDEIQGLALAKSGKIIAAGYATIGEKQDFALARYGTDGVLDTSFGVAGKVTTDFGGGAGEAEMASAVLIQKTGKIVAVGTALKDIALARYHPGGTLDTTFNGGSGTVMTGVVPGLWDVGFAALQAPNGRIVVAGSFDGLSRFGLARYMGVVFIWAPVGGRGIPFIPNVFDPYWWLKYNPVALLVGNALYVPAKLGFATIGAASGAVALVASLGQEEVARTIWEASLGGDYAITPGALARRESPRFVGGTQRPSQPVAAVGEVVRMAPPVEDLKAPLASPPAAKGKRRGAGNAPAGKP